MGNKNDSVFDGSDVFDPTSIKTYSVFEDFKLKGFFSEYLPPCFNLSDLSIAKLKGLKGPSKGSDNIEPYQYTMSRFTDDGQRRVLYLPEFGSYYLMTKYIENEGILDELIQISKNGHHSFSQIIQPDGTLTRHDSIYDNVDIKGIHDPEVINKSTYIPNIIKKINMSKGAVGILSLDIANFYRSIYTHYLPVIPLGFDNALKQYNSHKQHQNNPTGDEKAYKAYKTYKTYKTLDKKNASNEWRQDKWAFNRNNDFPMPCRGIAD